MAEFSWPVRVYYEDTDNGGVVYHANYLKFMERARTEWLRARGVEQDVLIEQEGLIFAVCSVQLDYLRPARFNQLLSVSVNVAEVGRASLIFDQAIHLIINEENDGVKSDLALCQGRIKVACLDASRLNPRAIPALVRQEILGDD